MATSAYGTYEPANLPPVGSQFDAARFNNLLEDDNRLRREARALVGQMAVTAAVASMRQQAKAQAGALTSEFGVRVSGDTIELEQKTGAVIRKVRESGVPDAPEIVRQLAARSTSGGFSRGTKQEFSTPELN